MRKKGGNQFVSALYNKLKNFCAKVRINFMGLPHIILFSS